ncbi:MAG: hypothetical protein KKF44_03760 [Nanoarchaeota archaeon]|nr:hypothetical protein [Nanoarchaeota archaeon]
MKKQIMIVLMAISLVASVLGAGDDLSPKEITMDYTDVQYVDYCINDMLPAAGVVPIEVLAVCKDTNGVSGCQAADIADPTGFDVAVLGDITTVAGAGCTAVMLTTDLAPEEAGLFYYTIGDGIEETDMGAVVRETGSVFIPEFGILASLAILGVAGAFVLKRRKD